MRREYFGNMGQVTDVMMPLDRDNGMHKGFAFVVLAEEAMALEVSCLLSIHVLCFYRLLVPRL